jgi:hypothetical protein
MRDYIQAVVAETFGTYKEFQDVLKTHVAEQQCGPGIVQKLLVNYKEKPVEGYGKTVLRHTLRHHGELSDKDTK